MALTGVVQAYCLREWPGFRSELSFSLSRVLVNIVVWGAVVSAFDASILVLLHKSSMFVWRCVTRKDSCCNPVAYNLCFRRKSGPPCKLAVFGSEGGRTATTGRTLYLSV